MNLRTIHKLFVIIAFFAVLISCGGSSGSSEDNSSDNSSDANSTDNNSSSDDDSDTGAVTVLLTDAPSETFDHIYATITGINLLGDDLDQIELFEGEERVDLLHLKNYAEIFTFADNIPAGTYSKIRLLISNLELVNEDGDGNELAAIQPKLPANGHIDINPQGDFTIAGGEHLVIEIDFDADKSFHIKQTGNGQYRFRPVIFANIKEQIIEKEKLLRVAGEIDSVDVDDEEATLCATTGSTSGSVEVCYELSIADNAGLFDEQGNPIQLDDIEVGDLATVTGWLTHDDGELDIDVAALELGSPIQLNGTLTAAIDDSAAGFTIDIADGQGVDLSGTLFITSENLTQVFDKAGNELDLENIPVGTELTISGILKLSDTETDYLAAAVIFADLTEDENFEGIITSIDTENNTLIIVNDAEEEICLQFSDDSQLFLIDNDDSSAALFNELVIGLEIDVFGSADIDDCVVVDTLLGYVQDDDDD